MPGRSTLRGRPGGPLYTLLLFLHSLVRWLVLGAIVGRFGLAISGLAGREAGPLDRRVGLAAMILADTQLLLGLVLFAVSPTIRVALGDMGAAMKDASLRFFTVEHTFVMVLALAAVHAGYAMTKRAEGARVHRIGAIAFGIALLLLLIGIPWPFRAVARPWLTLPM